MDQLLRRRSIVNCERLIFYATETELDLWTASTVSNPSNLKVLRHVVNTTSIKTLHYRTNTLSLPEFPNNLPVHLNPIAQILSTQYKLKTLLIKNLISIYSTCSQQKRDSRLQLINSYLRHQFKPCGMFSVNECFVLLNEEAV